MKVLKVLVLALFSIIIFFIGVWIFAPWQQAGLYALDSVRLMCAKSGVFMTYNDFRQEGVLSPTFTMRSFDIESPVAKLALSDVVVEILPLDSLLSGGASCRVRFGRSEIVMMPSNRLSLVRGSVTLAANQSTISASDADIAGELGVTGDATYNRINGTIPHSTLLIKVPENIGMLLSNPMLSRFIESAGQGEWRVKQSAPPKS